MTISRKYRVTYVDDEINDRTTQRICELLNGPDGLECTLVPPPKDIVEAATELSDGLLVDFDLSSQPDDPTDHFVSYYGSTLAAEVRMRKPACPIVLITKEERILGRSYFISESIDLDLVLFKSHIITDPDAAREEIVVLIEGFQALASVDEEPWQSVIRLMKANSNESDILREAAPPLSGGEWTVPHTAQWIRNVILAYPGILYDELTAATRLGISVDAFRHPSVRSLLSEAEYTGIFAQRRHWWRDRLFRTARHLSHKHKIDGPIAHTFSEAFHSEAGTYLEPSICVYDSTPTADWVCHILRQPVKQSHSIPYYPDKRPAVMDQARVSFKAIEESERFDETLVDADSLGIVKRLWGDPE